MIDDDQNLVSVFRLVCESRGYEFHSAGSAVQGLAAVFITRIAGSYSGIMGLPLGEAAELLTSIGWTPFASEQQAGAAS